jgi:hypothetical protein
MQYVGQGIIMAVLVEGISVIIKAQAIIERYPGGWPEFEANPPNKTLCADNELIRVGFMTPDDAKAFVERLSECGIHYLHKGKAVDLVIADQQRGLAAHCDWAEFGRIDLDGDPEKKVGACRLVGSAVNQIVMPDRWTYESSLSSRFTFVDSDSFSKRMKLIRHDNSVDVYRDLNTEKEVYVGRTSQKKCGTVHPIQIPEDQDPMKLDACRGYARMMNNLDVSHIAPWLAEDVTYSSQWVMEDMHGKEAYLNYIKGKLASIKRTGSRVWAEIAYTDAFGAGPCVVLSQGSQDNLTATLLLEIRDGKIISMIMCAVPSPNECRRTGEIPL